MASHPTRRGWLLGAIALCLSAEVSAGAAPLEPGGRRSSQLEVRLLTRLHSAKSKDGDAFDAVVVRDLTKNVPADTQVAPGTKVKGKVLYAKAGGVLKSVGVLTLQLTDVGGTPVESSRNHMSANPERPSGTEDLALAPGTVLRFNVRAASTGARRGR